MKSATITKSMHSHATRATIKVKTTYKSHTTTPYKPSKSVVLLDFDGVVCRNPFAHSFMMSRIHEYVQHVTGTTTAEKTITLNKHLYSVYGHSWKGLQKQGHRVTLDDFNDFVYRDLHMHSKLELSVAEILDFTAFMIRCKHNHIDIMFYSNAPSKWISKFVYWDATLFAVQDNILGKNKTLKPDWITYYETDAFLKDHGYDKIYFIDDCLKNLDESPDQWMPIWFTSSTKNNVSMWNVSSLKHGADLMCDFEKKSQIISQSNKKNL